MDTILLEQDNSTFISNVESLKNFFTLDYVTVSNFTAKKLNTRCHTLINFNIDLLRDRNIEITNAKLIIPLELIRTDDCNNQKKLTISYNSSEVSYNLVTWDTRPETVDIITIPLNNKSLRRKYLLVDVTDLINDWISNTINNYGLTISSDTPNLILVMPKNKLQSSPKVIIEYNYDYSSPEKLPDGSDTCSAEGIFIQGNNLSGKLINSRQPIKLNDLKTITPTGFSYDSNAGIVTISEEGYYFINWVLNLEGSDDGPKGDESSIIIGIKNLTTNNIINFYMPEVLQGQLTGSALIHVAAKNEQLILFNNSDKSLQISNTAIQGSLIISKI